MLTLRSAAAALALTLPTLAGGQGSLVRDTIVVGGVVREYYVYRPASADTSRPAPLVLVFHGRGADARDIARAFHFSEVAGAAGAVVVYPVGLKQHWNDDRGIFRDADDVAFVRALVRRLSARIRIDPHRIFAAGHSNGAMMANTLACQLPGIFAAIGTAGGPLAAQGVVGCNGAHPVSVVAVHGTADPLIPYAGGTLGADRGEIMSAENSVAFWAAVDGCALSPARTSLAPIDPSDSTRVTKLEFRSCRDGRSAVLYAIQGAGHGWPGSELRPADSISGPRTRQLDATKVIWEFFLAHPSP